MNKATSHPQILQRRKSFKQNQIEELQIWCTGSSVLTLTLDQWPCTQLHTNDAIKIFCQQRPKRTKTNKSLPTRMMLHRSTSDPCDENLKIIEIRN